MFNKNYIKCSWKHNLNLRKYVKSIIRILITKQESLFVKKNNSNLILNNSKSIVYKGNKKSHTLEKETMPLEAMSWKDVWFSVAQE